MTTPMMQQYREAKERHPGMLLLFRMGDFYELFHDDAEVVSRSLGLTLTTRDGSIPMAGFPHKALDTHLRNLLRAGHRVAICDQVEDPALAKGLVRREVTRVVTPGTLTEDDLLDPRQANYLAALSPHGPHGLVGLAWVDLSTGLFHATDLSRQRLIDELARLAPAECLVGEKDLAGPEGGPLERLRACLPGLTITARPDWTFDPDSARAVLFNHFQVTTLAGFGFEDDNVCLSAAGALVLYLQETLKSSLAHLSRLRPHAENRFLFLDEVTRRSLELTRTQRDAEREGSLLAVIDRTVTPMGARLLAEWIVTPLAERLAIERRLDAVAELLEDHGLRAELRTTLADAFDLQRLTARVSTGRASPRDLHSVGRTLALLPRLKAKVTARRSALLRDLESRLELCADLRELLESALVDSPPQTAREGGVIRRGYAPDLDELHEIASSGKDWITKFQAEEITRTGISSLKVGFNQVFGYYIEITHTHSHKIPADYQRKQTLKNAERYITTELKEYEEKVLGAQEKIGLRETELFNALRDKVAADTGRLLQTAEVLAWLDVLASLAEVAAERHYCRPILADEPILDLVDGRHPILDQTLPPGTLVPNSTKMGSEDGFFVLLTGPNMGGKSVFIRQVALLTLMAQMGSFVPAREARIGLVDRIFTRVGASDELSRGQSTFMVEMTEAANILNNATTRSLVILDEIGRGTSTYDGVSLAWGITEYLHDTIGCRTLFATHYHELAQLAERLTNLRNYNALVLEDEVGIVFLHRIAPGSADKSYGIHVAQRAGVPAEVLERARQVLAELEAHHLHTPDRPGTRLRRPRIVQASLFANTEDPILEELRSLDVAKAKPEDLVALVRKWQRDLRKS
jgi:DNA mismatch repair protein MutS